mmetsp:Transcript_74630/g.242451  ORF Transcript_74630/g.242451 Transcript_74630/m.242451 type:complete len:278 (-) Transcript_74630:54-887(-)
MLQQCIPVVKFHDALPEAASVRLEQNCAFTHQRDCCLNISSATYRHRPWSPQALALEKCVLHDLRRSGEARLSTIDQRDIPHLKDRQNRRQESCQRWGHSIGHSIYHDTEVKRWRCRVESPQSLDVQEANSGAQRDKALVELVEPDSCRWPSVQDADSITSLWHRLPHHHRRHRRIDGARSASQLPQGRRGPQISQLLAAGDQKSTDCDLRHGELCNRDAEELCQLLTRALVLGSGPTDLNLVEGHMLRSQCFTSILTERTSTLRIQCDHGCCLYNG